MSEWFRVEVSDKDGQVVAIETEMLAGRDIGDAEVLVIHKAIAHLSGFLGAQKATKWDDRLAIINAMQAHGGSFVKALALAWRHADPSNSARIEAAFPEYVEKYRGLVEIA